MKTLLFFAMAFCFICVGTYSANAQCARYGQSHIKCGYYDEGLQDGANDARNNQRRDHQRYRNKFERQYESIYREGYDAGFAGGEQSGSQWDSLQRSNYDAGYNFGLYDRRGNLSRSASRYSGQANANYFQIFQQGYNDGYDNRPKQTGSGGSTFPTYPTYPPGSGGGGPGTSSGSATWSGRVDDRARVIIQGNTIRAEAVSGSGLRPGNQNMNGVLPRRASTVYLRKEDGRGTAQIIEQPTRRNGFAAIIEINDPRGGDDNYRLEISWQAGNVSEEYSRGSVRWRGRVDDRVNVVISGNDVWAETISGQATFNETVNVDGYLAARPGSINVRKRDGRGQVTVLQQPSNQNNYTAVIQIYDSDGGDDDYDLDITW
ncbi:MAG: hypothetical protein WBD22_03315 [Pyrinomonadaceae bacterium]